MDGESVFDEKYEYNCPQFVDFGMPQSMNDDKADAYFDFDHEVGQPIDGIAFEPDEDVRIPETAEEASVAPEVTSPKATSCSHRHSQEDTTKLEELHHEKEEQIEISHTPDRVDHKNNIVDSPVGEAEQTVAIADVRPASATDGEQAVAGDDAGEECNKDDSFEGGRTDEGVEGEHKEEADESVHEDVEVDEHEHETQASERRPHVEVDEHEQETQASETRPDSPPADEVHAEESEACNDIRTEGGHVQQEETMEVEGRHTPAAPEEMMTDDHSEDTATGEEPAKEDMEDEVQGTVTDPPALTLSNVVTSFDTPATRAPTNIVTSWGNQKSTSQQKGKKNAIKDTRSRPTTRRSTRSLNSDSGALKRAMGGESSQRRSLRIKHRASDSPAIKRRRVSDKSRSQSSTGRQARPAVGPPPSKPFIAKLTLPTTPTCLKRNAVKPGAQFKTTEQLEMERIADFRRQLAEHKKQSQASYRKVQESGSYQAKRAAALPTRPEAFNFETDRRVKQHPMATRQDARSFEQNLRKSGATSPTRVTGPRGPTVAKPFNFAEGRKRKFEEGETKNSPYVSMATRITQFHTKTPQRYHTRRSGDNNNRSLGQQEAPVKPRLTCPKTPQLESRNRKRPVAAQSAAEKEEQEVQEMKSYQFKARPVNPRVMSNLNIGLKMASHKEPTKPVGFCLESERRMKEREAKKAEEEAEAEAARRKEEEDHAFHARPMPVKMLEGPVGLAEVKARPLTCPKSPAFALKNRVRTKEDSMIEQEESKSHMVRATPIMHVGVPFKPQVTHKTTELQPFSFEQRDRETKARKEARIQEIYQEEEKARQFKAQPILESTSLPEKRVKPGTKQEPFRLAMDERGAKRAEEWSKKIEEELHEQRAQANMFKAKTAEVLYHAPFVPQKPSKPLTEISGFDLNTDRRATEREQFEQLKLRRELEERERRCKLDRLRGKEEQEEVERMRREEMVHRAQPVKHYRPVNIQPSLRPLTEAQSPNFSDRFQK